MPLERIFLYLVIVATAVWVLVIAISSIAVLPWGLIGLAVLAFAGYIAWRLIAEHTMNEEDRYYEDRFDK